MTGAHLSLSYSKSWTEGIVGAFLFGGIFVLQYLLQPLGISPSILAMMPYAATLLVLVFGGFRGDRRKLSAPAMLGEPYFRGNK